MMPQIQIANRKVGGDAPTYFIADISANHDGDFERARALIYLAAEAGADAAKFQNFAAAKIVSDYGFRSLGGQLSHQAKWEKSVFEVYRDASIPDDWIPALKEECAKARIDYFSSPYHFEAVDMLDPFVDVYKIGSGDLTWPEMLQKIAGKGKPVFLATGASDIGEVEDAVGCILAMNRQLVLMQCNTNYTGSLENFRHTHLNVLKTYATMFPDVVLGLSDHTPRHAPVLGAVALGARVIEKHFTDDNSRQGPDHLFSMTPAGWREMVDRTRELELALGSPRKCIAQNEEQTVIVQRRCIRAARDIPAGTCIERHLLDVLRPAPRGSISPYELQQLLGRKTAYEIRAGQEFRWELITP